MNGIKEQSQIKVSQNKNLSQKKRIQNMVMLWVRVVTKPWCSGDKTPVTDGLIHRYQTRTMKMATYSESWTLTSWIFESLIIDPCEFRYHVHRKPWAALIWTLNLDPWTLKLEPWSWSLIIRNLETLTFWLSKNKTELVPELKIDYGWEYWLQKSPTVQMPVETLSVQSHQLT